MITPPFFITNYEKLINSCISFYNESKNKMNLKNVTANRVNLSNYIRTFHKDCETLTPSVNDGIENLKNDKGLVLMTAHQPNLFAYSGVLRKATLIHALAKKIEEILKVPVVCYFGIADQDFTDDRWVRSCQLPK